MTANSLPVDSEEIVTRLVTGHLQSYWPNALYHIDFGSGANLSKTQAGKQALLQGRRGHPDLMIYEQRGSYLGLAIELKREDETLYKARKPGEPRSDHIREQIIFLRELEKRGWYTVFGIGAPDTIELIGQYLRGELEPERD